MSLLIFTSLFLVPLFLIWLYLHKTKSARLTFSRMVNIKTGAPMPGLSHLESFYNLIVRRFTIGNAELAIYESNKYGGIHRTSLFGYPCVTVADPILVKQVLKKIEDFPKAPPMELFGEINKMFGTRSIININQPEWHDLRSTLNKAFTSNKIFFQPMQKKAYSVFHCGKKENK